MVYVFGGNGFVGSFLANKLTELNYEVTCCDLQDSLNARISNIVKYQKCDIRDISQIRQICFQEHDIIVNLAANQYHLKVPKNRHKFFFDTNVAGAENILKAAFEKGVSRGVFFSSDMVYGLPLYLPVDTKHPQNPIGPYGLSKKQCESVCRDYRNKGMKITIFRPRMINGPGRLGILKKLFFCIRKGLPVPTIGNGKNHYQMISVFDCVSAIIQAIEKDFPNKEYNLGSELSPDITTLLKNAIQKAGSHSAVIHLPGNITKKLLTFFDKIGMTVMYPEQFMIADQEYVLNIADTQKDLDWTPQYNDSDMLVEAYQNFSERAK